MTRRWMWYPNTLSGWLIVHRRLGLGLDLRQFLIGVIPRSFEVKIMLGVLTIRIHLDDYVEDGEP